jgi:hypothetical protein
MDGGGSFSVQPTERLYSARGRQIFLPTAAKALSVNSGKYLLPGWKMIRLYLVI